MTIAIDQWIDGALSWGELLQILNTNDSGRILTGLYMDGDLTFAQLLQGLSYVAD